MRLTIINFLALGTTALANYVIHVDSTNFHDIVGPGKAPALVEFCTPENKDCKKVLPEFVKLADTFSAEHEKIQMVRVDVEGDGKIFKKQFGIKKLPSIKYFPSNLRPEDYTGKWTLDDMADFVIKKTGAKATFRPRIPRDIKDVNVGNFEEIVLDPKKTVFVAFIAPWCAFSKEMGPSFEAVAKSFAPEEDKCILAYFDGNEIYNEEIMAKYGGSHFPTLKIFPAGDAKDKPVVYKGGRTEKELTDFLNEHCGTFRAVGGGLNEKAGLVTEWDNRIHEYMHSTAEKAASIKRGLLREMRETDTEVGKLYLKALESLGTKDGEEWLDTEVKRLDQLIRRRHPAVPLDDSVFIHSNILHVYRKHVKVRDEL